MRIRSVALLLASQLFALASGAEGISIYPTTVLLDPGHRVGTVTIRNQANHEVTYELAGYRWSQTDDRDVLTRDRAFVVTPPVIVLRAGEERIVRVGLLSDPPAGGAEQAFRLRISELPHENGRQGANLNVRLQLLLPVFEARRDTPQELEFAAHHNSQGEICIEGDNKGDAHAKLVWVADADRPDQKTPVQKYMLAGSRGQLCVDKAFTVGRSVAIGVTSAHQRDVKPYETPITDP